MVDDRQKDQGSDCDIPADERQRLGRSGRHGGGRRQRVVICIRIPSSRHKIDTIERFRVGKRVEPEEGPEGAEEGSGEESEEESGEGRSFGGRKLFQGLLCRRWGSGRWEGVKAGGREGGKAGLRCHS